MSEFDIKTYSPIPDARAAELQNNLMAAGQSLADDDLRPFLLSIEDDAGHMTAGCRGEIAFRSARISQLWVDASHRRQGVGGMLLRAAEAHANAHHCIRIHLETRNEAARALYEREGYRVFGRLPNYEGANTFYYLEKRLV